MRSSSWSSDVCSSDLEPVSQSFGLVRQTARCSRLRMVGQSRTGSHVQERFGRDGYAELDVRMGDARGGGSAATARVLSRREQRANGRESCGERAGLNGKISVVDGTIKKKTKE